jgi:hypothetical protein
VGFNARITPGGGHRRPARKLGTRIKEGRMTVGRVRGGSDITIVSIVLASLLLPVLLSPADAQNCAGDCSADNAVTVDEVLTTVQIALGNDDVAVCPAADSDGAGGVTVDDVLRAVGAALNGCGPAATPTPQPTVGPTATAAVNPLGSRRFDLDPAASALRVIDQLAPPFNARRLAGLRGMSGGQVEDGFLVLQGAVPNRQGVALIDVVDGSDYFFADASAQIEQVLCLAPEYPAERAGIVDCDGGTDVSVVSTLDHKPGQLGVEGWTVARCEMVGGTIESPHQICGNPEMLGESCRVAADCNLPPGTPNGVCGVEVATCTRGRVGAQCRDDGTCDTGPGLLDGICGIEGPHPGICNPPLRVEQLATSGPPGGAILAPLTVAGEVLSGLPARLTFEQSLPCGDEGQGDLVMLSMTTGQARTAMIDFNLLNENIELDETGESLACSNWASATGGAFVLGIPRIHASTNLFDILYAISLVAD